MKSTPIHCTQKLWRLSSSWKLNTIKIITSVWLLLKPISNKSLLIYSPTFIDTLRQLLVDFTTCKSVAEAKKRSLDIKETLANLPVLIGPHLEQVFYTCLMVLLFLAALFTRGYVLRSVETNVSETNENVHCLSLLWIWRPNGIGKALNSSLFAVKS